MNDRDEIPPTIRLKMDLDRLMSEEVTAQGNAAVISKRLNAITKRLAWCLKEARRIENTKIKGDGGLIPAVDKMSKKAAAKVELLKQLNAVHQALREGGVPSDYEPDPREDE